MRYYLILLLVVAIFSCTTKKSEEKNLYYYVTNNQGFRSGIKEESFKYKAIIKNDSMKIYDKDRFVYSLKYKINENGIYIFNQGVPKLLYSFKMNFKLKREDYLTNFFYKEVELIAKKTYNVNNNSFTVYHFLENGVSETLDSYYLVGEGFICFYKYDSDDFIYLDSPKANELSSDFLKDSTFFAQLKLRKLDMEMGRKFD